MADQASDDGVGSQDTKRHRSSSGGARQVGRKLLLRKSSAGSVSSQELPQPGLTTSFHSTTQRQITEEERCARGDFTGWGQDKSGLNPWVSTKRRDQANLNPNQSTVLGVLNDGTNVCLGSRILPACSSSIRMPPSAILPVRSTPASLKYLAASTRTLCRDGSMRIGYEKKTEATSSKNPQYAHEEKKSAASAAGDISSPPGIESVDKVCSALVGDNGAVEKTARPFAQSEVEFPGIPGSFGGISLRLSPEERPLEPWHSTITPLRAMCDVDRSLSRAGIEYRGVIHAVDMAQEMQSYDQVKVISLNMARLKHTTS